MIPGAEGERGKKDEVEGPCVLFRCNWSSRKGGKKEGGGDQILHISYVLRRKKRGEGERDKVYVLTGPLSLPPYVHTVSETHNSQRKERGRQFDVSILCFATRRSGRERKKERGGKRPRYGPLALATATKRKEERNPL